MKNNTNSTVSLWSLMGLISLLGVLLVSLSVFAQQTDISIEPTNAVQHIDYVRIEQENNSDNYAQLGRIGSGLLNIETNSNILLGDDNEFSGNNSISSAILGGNGNVIRGGRYSTIIAGENNDIDGGESNTILGGQNNKIYGNNFSTIAGGRGNSVNGNSSAILGGENNILTGNYSVIVGNDNQVEGDNSVAMGVNSRVNGNNSFLWTDGGRELDGDDIFAVVSTHGMAINSAPDYDAKLTVGGPLVVSINDNDQNVECGGNKGGGTIKTVYSENSYCLCSCDGKGRNSMYGKGKCQSICRGESDDTDTVPQCGTGLYMVQSGDNYSFHGTCDAGLPVEGTGAYLVDKNDVIHWSCQTSNGLTTGCTYDAGEEGAPELVTFKGCELPVSLGGGTIKHGESVIAYLSDSPVGECMSQSRVCNNGNLDGNEAYTYKSCGQGCKKPWNNEYIPDGKSLIAYKSSTALIGEICESEVRVCNNGTLNGSYYNSGCNERKVSCYYRGNSYPYGEILETYSKSSTTCPESCDDVKVSTKCYYNGFWVSSEDDSQLTPANNRNCSPHSGPISNGYQLSQCPRFGECQSVEVSIPNGQSCQTKTMYKFNACLEGYYGNEKGCKQCPTGYTSKKGSNYAEEHCFIECGKGAYLAKPRQEFCTPCPGDGMISNASVVYFGQTSQCLKESAYTACKDGEYWYEGECKKCPEGYRSERGLNYAQERCFIECGAGQYLGHPGQESCVSCPKGMVSDAHWVYYGQTSQCSEGVGTIGGRLGKTN